MFFKNHSTLRMAVVLLLVYVLGIQGVSPAQAGAENLQTGTVYRVSPGGATNGSCGADWSTPCGLQYALTIATSGAEIWVQQGTYKPGTSDRNSTFLLKDGVAVYGGFAGTEASLSLRNSDPSTNNTVLSGDLDGDSTFANNAYHVVSANFVFSTAILDGFKITGGNANSATENFGGGIYSANSSPTLNNLIIDANTTNNAGGGMYAVTNHTQRSFYTTPTLTNVVFSNNIATRGGGLYTQNASPILLNVVFSGNTATSGAGGGMNNQTQTPATDEYSVPQLTNVTFSGNTANGGGGLYNNNSNPTLINVTFSGNTANIRGGAIFNEGASPIIKHVTISGNTAPVGFGGGIRNTIYGSLISNPVIENTILWGDTSEEMTGDGTGTITIKDSVIQGGCPAGATCTNVLSTNPVLSTLANNGGFTQTRALGFGSSAINAGGVNSTCSSTDQRGTARPQGGGCDIGAYEAYLLTVTADPKTITYGNSDPTFTFQYSGFVGGDNESVIDTPPTCGVSGVHTDAGNYPIACLGGADNKYLFFAYVNSTLTINKATPTLSVTNSPATYNGSPQAATVSGSVPGTPGNILTGGSSTQTNAGTYTVTADFVPNDTTNYNSLTNTSAGSFTINKANPTLSVTNSPVTYNGLSKSATVSGSVSGSVSNILTGGSASQITAGTYAVTANFTPDDTANYNPLTNAPVGNFIINKANPFLFVTNSPVGFDGQPHAATVDSSVPGSISNILTGGSATQTNFGTYPVTANFTPDDTVNYNILTNASAGDFVISPDVTPPDTKLNIRPANPSGADVTFTFSSTDGTATFECQLDDGGFSACTSPKNYTGLANGSHIFEVRARDPANNIDSTPSTYTWTVAVNASSLMGSVIVAPSSLIAQSGSTNGLNSSLGFFEQNGTDDDAGTYVLFQTPGVVFVGHRSFHIPDDIQTSLISNALLQVNVNGPASSTQIWTWSIYDWNSNLWIKLGDTIGSTADQWNSMTFSIRNIQNYISPTREVRIQLRSSNDINDLKMDYEALHLTYRSVTITPTPSAPSMPTGRPGIASAAGSWMVR